MINKRVYLKGCKRKRAAILTSLGRTEREREISILDLSSFFFHLREIEDNRFKKYNNNYYKSVLFIDR